ncbi:unnamed protein product [Sphagnum compactum]
MKEVNPSIAGIMRNVTRTNVGFGNYIGIPWKEVELEMHNLLRFLNSAEARNVDIVELAALAHFFNVNFGYNVNVNQGLPFVLVPVKDRVVYIETSKQAHFGDRRAFLRFVVERLQGDIEVCADILYLY